MPLYEFHCPDCPRGDDYFDKIVPLNSTETVCRCGRTAKRSTRPTPFAFGSGSKEVQKVGNQGVIVEHAGRRYFRPDKERYRDDAVRARIEDTHGSIVKKRLEAGEKVDKDELQVLKRKMV